MTEAASAPRSHRGLRSLLAINLGAAAFIFVLLEVWRPCYFLTDDSMDGYFPVLAGMGRRMLHGQSPFVSEYLFGGDYNLLHDCLRFLWHPIYFLAALMANTPARFYTLEFLAFFFLMLTAAGFTCLASHLRRELRLPLSDALLSLYTLSFTYSMIILCVGPSWMPYLGNHSAMPWLALGILQTTWRRGLGLVTLFSLHHILAGHLEVAIPVSFFLTLFAAGVAYSRRSWVPLLSWIGGYALALVLLLPLLVPAAEGYFASNWSEGLPEQRVAQFAVPVFLFPFSLFLSTFSLRLNTGYLFGECPPCYSVAFVSCAAAWALIPALTSRRRWAEPEILGMGIVALAALLIIRPSWINPILLHIPLLRSLRWPFRQIVEFQFFLHLFLVLRPLDGTSPWFRRSLITTGLVIFITPLPFLPAPTFGAMEFDRTLLFSGAADTYWSRVKARLGPDDVIVAIADPRLMDSQFKLIPFTLLGAGNYPELFQVRSGSGYSETLPRAELYFQTRPAKIMGIFAPFQKADILAERPNVRFITLESADPLQISLSSRGGPPIELIELRSGP